MTSSPMQILIAADDPKLIASLTNEVVSNFDANVTVVNTLEEARDMTLTSEYDVILASEKLPDGHGTSLLSDSKRKGTAPVLLLDDALNAQHVLTALRQGAADVFPTPLESDRLVSVIRSVVAQDRERKHLVKRSQRLRRITTKLVRDRRELRQRVDLICRDLVFAYRRLAKKVVDIHAPQCSDQDDGIEPFDPSA